MLAVALGLSGCEGQSYGTAANGFFMPQIAPSYVALEGGNIFGHGNAAAVVIAPGIAVTNAHNDNIVDKDAVIGRPADYDLLYFRTAKTATLATAAPVDGEAVIAYGQGIDGSLRVSHGVIRQFWPAAFAYAADAGPGFSGGPVLDARTGALVGITYGYQDAPGGRMMVAYTMAFVASEYQAVKAASAASSNRINR
jgi:V8-like Glu-specific endopeptidase